MMKEMLGSSYLFGANAPFIEALYDAYLKDPASVEPRWRGYFDELQRIDAGTADVSHYDVQERFAGLARQRRAAAPTVVINRPQLGEKQFGVLQLISAYRFQGVRHADLDPLKRQEKPVIPELDPAFYGLTGADMDTVFNAGTLAGPREMKLRDIVQFLKDTYCRTIGVEYMYITDMVQKRWIQERLESVRSTPSYDADSR
jgi:2-oxoglutarate dehydrogenase E1 component